MTAEISMLQRDKYISSYLSIVYNTETRDIFSCHRCVVLSGTCKWFLFSMFSIVESISRVNCTRTITLHFYQPASQKGTKFTVKWRKCGGMIASSARLWWKGMLRKCFRISYRSWKSIFETWDTLIYNANISCMYIKFLWHKDCTIHRIYMKKYLHESHVVNWIRLKLWSVPIVILFWCFFSNMNFYIKIIHVSAKVWRDGHIHQ